MTEIAIIGGTGLTRLENLTVKNEQSYDTKYGQTSAPLVTGILENKEIIFLARHGSPHNIPPHMVNYRANLFALKECGIKNIISINAVGGISSGMSPCKLVVPYQIIDYTSGRDHTFFDGPHDNVVHIDFTYPYCEDLRSGLIRAGHFCNIDLIESATYGATQGPRLESAAEIRRMEKDGCDVVGMTGMPETALAKELGLCYASLCLVVNWAAGKSDDVITMESIRNNLEKGMQNVMHLISCFLKKN